MSPEGDSGFSTGDVSERIRALVFTGVADVVFFLRVEGDRFRFVQINPAFTKATGLSPETVEGKLIDEVIPEPSLTLVKSKYREAIEERRTIRWEEVTVYPNGKKTGEVSISPVLEADGRCTALVGTVHDVTETSAARALARTEQRILEMVAAGSPLEETMTVLVKEVQEELPSGRASIFLVADDGRSLRACAAPDLHRELVANLDGARFSEAGPIGAAASLGSPAISIDLTDDVAFAPFRGIAVAAGLRGFWSLPILGTANRILGVLSLQLGEPRSPEAPDLRLLSRAASLAGTAITRHQLDEQLHDLSARLDSAREEERTAIAREIHDRLGQSLTVIRMDAAGIARRAETDAGLPKEELLDRLRELSGHVDRLIHDVRRISAELRPAVLDDLGLVAALEWEAEQWQARTGIRCTVRSEPGEPPKPAHDVSTVVFRVFQEALTNVERHAGANAVEISLAGGAEHLLVEIRDDGRGIRGSELADPRSLGLLGMRERARRVGGTAMIASAVPHGTIVTLRLPFRRPTAAGATKSR